MNAIHAIHVHGGLLSGARGEILFGAALVVLVLLLLSRSSGRR